MAERRMTIKEWLIWTAITAALMLLAFAILPIHYNWWTLVIVAAVASLCADGLSKLYDQHRPNGTNG